MPTSQRPLGLPPFFHELSNEERMLLASARHIERQLQLVYRLRGRGKSADEQDNREGWLREVHFWFACVQALGDRLQEEYAQAVRLD